MHEWKISFSKDSVIISKNIESPLDGQFKEREIEKIGYDDLINLNNLHMVVNKIERDIDNGTLKSLIFYASEFKLLESSQNSIKTTNVDSESKVIIIGKEEIQWRIFRDLITEPTYWLLKNNRIQKKDLPVYDVSHGKRYILHWKKEHSTGKEFDSFEKIDLQKLLEEPYLSSWGDLVSEGIYLHTNYARDDCKRNGEYLMSKFAPDVKFSILGYSGA